ncbi:hypothetical protein QE152_g41341, partial [Popillia japonica]
PPRPNSGDDETDDDLAEEERDVEGSITPFDGNGSHSIKK